jgi:hypothetical protein
MENHKTLFQQISTSMEAALERYKNQYPKNIGQIVRHNFGKIVVVSVCFIIMVCLFSMSMKLGLFMMAGTPGILIFTLLLASCSKDEDTQKSGDLQTIQKLKSKMASLLSYPDVSKYCEGFNAKVDEATAQKEAIQKRFRDFVMYGSVSMVVIIGLLIIRGFFISGQMNSNSLPDDDDDISIKEKMELSLLHDLGINQGETFCTLQPLQPDRPALQFCYTEYTEQAYDVRYMLTVSNPEDLCLEDEDYCITITYSDGLPVPRCPKFMFSGPACRKIKSEDFDFQYVRVLKLLKEHQMDLRYDLGKPWYNQ